MSYTPSVIEDIGSVLLVEMKYNKNVINNKVDLKDGLVPTKKYLKVIIDFSKDGYLPTSNENEINDILIIKQQQIPNDQILQNLSTYNYSYNFLNQLNIRKFYIGPLTKANHLGEIRPDILKLLFLQTIKSVIFNNQNIKCKELDKIICDYKHIERMIVRIENFNEQNLEKALKNIQFNTTLVKLVFKKPIANDPSGKPYMDVGVALKLIENNKTLQIFGIQIFKIKDVNSLNPLLKTNINT